MPLQVRHGALLGLAEVVHGLAQLGLQAEPSIQPALAALPQQVVAGKLLRGKGGDTVRTACCRCARPPLRPPPAAHPDNLRPL